MLVGLLTTWNAGSDLGSDGSAGRIALGLAVTCGGLVGGGSVWLGRSSWAGLGWRGGDTSSDTARLVGLGLAQTAVIVCAVAAAYGWMGGTAAVAELAWRCATMPVEERLFFFAAGVRNAFVEESLFRGDLLPALTARVGAPAAVVVSAAMFALFHRSLDPLPLGMKFGFGLLFGWSAARTGSLLPSALSHAGMWTILGDS